MAQLKEHMFREIATDLCGRVQYQCYSSKQNCLPSLEKFVLSGKEPVRVFRRIVVYDITIMEVTPYKLLAKYRGDLWRHEPSFLHTLMILWAKKLHCYPFQCLYNTPKRGYSKVLAKNTDFAELSFIYSYIEPSFWLKILEAFPKLVTLKVHAQSFASMLSVAPTQLVCLKEVELTGYSANELLTAHTALSEHQYKLPSLDTIHYSTSMKNITFPYDVSNVSSVKHLKVDDQHTCRKFVDFSFLPTAQQMFPSLESAEIDISIFGDSVDNNKTPQLDVVKSFYEAFESLSLGFSIEVTYDDVFSCSKKEVAELRAFFATKGKIYDNPEYILVATSAPGRRLTYNASFIVLPDSKIL